MPSDTNSRATTFKGWLNGRPADENLLSGYVQSIGAEWWASEWKACEELLGFGVRKTVGAMANGVGGELFIGVKDDRSFPGTSTTLQQLEQELSQPLAVPGSWYLVNLLQPVRFVTQVELSTSSPIRRVFALELVAGGLPALVRDDDGTLALYLRSGGSSIRADGFRAMEWSRTTSRERLLLAIFREFETMVHQVRISVGYDIRATAGISPRLPYLVRSLEDGRFYELLTDEDIKALLGRRTPSWAGDSQGFLSRFLELEDRVWQVRNRQARDVIASSVERMTIQELSSEHQLLEQNVSEFRSWLVQQRILPEPRV